MSSPDRYRRQIKDLGLDRMRIKASTIAEAKEFLREIRRLQKELRQIKRNINLDIKAYRAEYRRRSSSAASTSSAVLSLFGKRRTAGRLRAEEKRRLARERDRAIAPYESLKLTIDDLIVQLDSAKDQLQIFIEQTRAEEQMKKQQMKTQQKKSKQKTSTDKSSKYCPECGSLVAKSDKFCRECGSRLK